MGTSTLPADMKAVFSEEVGKGFQLKTIKTPEPVTGSVVVKVLATAVNHSTPLIAQGIIPFPQPKNYVPGGCIVGRVVAAGSDATVVQPGQLVIIEPFIRARDSPEQTKILFGTHDGGHPTSRKFTQDNWSQAGFAEYARAPLENTHVLNEKLLCGSPDEGGFGYTYDELLAAACHVVGLGGLSAIDVQAGERIVIAPATGGFSGGAVQVAVALGANVIAIGRNLEVLNEIKSAFPDRVQIVQNTGDVEKDAEALKQWGPVDAFLDISPVQAAKSTHLRSCFLALKEYGRAVLMGVVNEDLAMPYSLAVWKSLTVIGQWMYGRKEMVRMVRMVESGVLKLGAAGGFKPVAKFGLEEYEEAFAALKDNATFGHSVVLLPHRE